MSKKKKYIENHMNEFKDYAGFQEFQEMLTAFHLKKKLNDNERRFLIRAGKRGWIKLLRKTGKYGAITAFFFFLTSFWKKIITSLLGKVTVITVATTATVATGYYVKKTLLDVQPQPVKKIEIYHKEKPVKKPIVKTEWHFAFNELKIEAPKLDKNTIISIKKKFYAQLSAKNKQDREYELFLAINYIDSVKQYTVTLYLYKILSTAHKEIIYTNDIEAKNLMEIFSFCENQAKVLFQKYVK